MMRRSRFKYFVFKYFLILLGDKWFSAFIRGFNALRFDAPFWKNVISPKDSFSFKLNKFKSSEDAENLRPFADKLFFRNHIAKEFGEKYLAPLIAQFENVNDFILDESDCPCFIKLNRGSGMNIFVGDYQSVSIEDIKRELKFWMTIDPYYYSRERHYSNTKPAIFIEKSLGHDVDDYKVFCFQGKPKLIQVDHGRFTQHTRSFFNTDWSPSAILLNYQRIPVEIPKPACLEEMMLISERLSSEFAFLRVDFYVVNGVLYIGEMTFFPEGGHGVFHNHHDDLLLGGMIISDRLNINQSFSVK